MLQSRPRILVVEESYPTALAVCDMIVRNGCEVAGMVEHVDKGLEFVRDNALDGAVIDSDLHGDGSSRCASSCASATSPSCCSRSRSTIASSAARLRTSRAPRQRCRPRPRPGPSAATGCSSGSRPRICGRCSRISSRSP